MDNRTIEQIRENETKLISKIKSLEQTLNEIREYVNTRIQILETKYSYEKHDEYMNAKLLGGKKELEKIDNILGEGK